MFSIVDLIICRHISNLPQPRGWEKKIAEGPPCVVLASPGFMQTGTSRELFELWAPDSRNGLIVTGYSVEGTLARVSLIIRPFATYRLWFFVYILLSNAHHFPSHHSWWYLVPDRVHALCEHLTDYVIL
jgi:hypothetical protein